MTSNYPCQLPPPLKPGNLLTVIASSAALRELEAFERGLQIWRSLGYRIELGSNWDARDGYLAGSDRTRREALKSAWQNPECKGILCVREGKITVNGKGNLDRPKQHIP